MIIKRTLLYKDVFSTGIPMPECDARQFFGRPCLDFPLGLPDTPFADRPDEKASPPLSHDFGII
jgi:hypothetical protein